ncbi:MAG: alanyl-tRNA editing protein [Oscillospiraceae bacterium]|nr:alanyl-tRNA editing protein [Oscillospiraceae bacterium]
MTEKLYYIDSHIREFDAMVISCEPDGDHFHVELDRTAFFPEGGGQCADTGTLSSVAVSDVQEVCGRIVHYCASPLTVGESVHGSLNWGKRFQNMQSHSGEHIVSGLVHNRFGFENVGFHLGADGMIVDFSGYVTPDELREIELAANKIIWQNRKITAFFPAPDELIRYNYRSKLELTENVRLVEIDGVDLCACCAPHVKETGEIGMIRIFESQRRKDGVRIRMLAGKNALEDYLVKEREALRISNLLSAKVGDISSAAERILTERDALSYKLRGYELRELDGIISEASTERERFVRFFDSLPQEDMLRIIKGVAPFCKSVAAVFSGSDEGGYKFIIASEHIALREKLNSIRPLFTIKGSGSDKMVQGSIFGSRKDIENAVGGW